MVKASCGGSEIVLSVSRFKTVHSFFLQAKRKEEEEKKTALRLFCVPAHDRQMIHNKCLKIIAGRLVFVALCFERVRLRVEV